MRKLLLLLGVFLLSIGCVQAAVPAIDASGDTKATVNSSGSPAISATTTSGNVLVLFAIQVTKRASLSHVVSISGGGLTWAARKTFGNTFTSLCFSNNTCFSDTELWWACSVSALSSTSITATLNQTTDEIVMIVVGITGVCPASTPWDTNVGLPVTNTNISSSNSNIQVAGVNTSSASDMLIVVVGAPAPIFAGLGDQASCSGWAQYSTDDSGGPNDYADLALMLKPVSSTQALTIGVFSAGCATPNSQPRWVAFADAATNAAPQSSGGRLMLLGVGN